MWRQPMFQDYVQGRFQFVSCFLVLYVLLICSQWNKFLLSWNKAFIFDSQRGVASLSYQVLSHNILRDNCCNWTTTTTSVSFGLFRFSAVSVHSVSSVHGAQVHRCWSRTLHTTLVLWKQTDFQPPCSLRNLQRKFQFLQKQSTLLSIAKDCLPTSFQKAVSWDHIQRNSYHYYTLHGNLGLTYLEFQIYNPFDRQIIVSCTLQAWRWTRIHKTHSVVLDPLLRNDVACSPWVYQPAGLGISYPYTTYILLQCAAQVVRHRSLSTRCPCGPLWPTSIWSSLHCKRFDYHSSLVSTLLLNFWFLRLLSLTRLFTFFDFSKLSSFPSTFASALATFALGSRLCLGLCTRLGSWGSSRFLAGILGPAVLSCMTWLAAMAAFHWLWAITRKVSFLAAVVASDTLRAMLWPCSHMHFAVQVIGESHSGVVCNHRLPNPGNSSCTTVELNILCHLLRQISQIHQKLVALVDTQITQLACNQWSLQHGVKSLNLSSNLSKYIHKGMPLWLLHHVLQASFPVLQRLWTAHQTELSAQQSQKLKTICFLNAIKSNLRFHHIVNPGVSRKALL